MTEFFKHAAVAARRIDTGTGGHAELAALLRQHFAANGCAYSVAVDAPRGDTVQMVVRAPSEAVAKAKAIMAVGGGSVRHCTNLDQ